MRRRGLTVSQTILRHLNSPGHQLHVALLHVGKSRWGWHLEDGLVPRADMCGHVAQASWGAVALLLDIEVHLAIMLVDDVRLEAVALAVLDSACSTDVGTLACTQQPHIRILVTHMQKAML